MEKTFALYVNNFSIAYFEHIFRNFCIPADDELIKHISSAWHKWLRNGLQFIPNLGIT